jgi:hypothetical protein
MGYRRFAMLSTQSNDKVVSDIVSILESKGAKKINVEENTIYFDGGISSMLNSKPYSNLLSFITSGKIHIRNIELNINEINFHLNFIGLIIISIPVFIVITIMFIIFKLEILLILLLAILFFIAGNIGLTILRFVKLLKSLI